MTIMFCVDVFDRREAYSIGYLWRSFSYEELHRGTRVHSNAQMIANKLWIKGYWGKVRRSETQAKN